MAEKAQNPMVLLRQELVKAANDLKAALPAHLTEDRFIRNVITQFQRTPELFDCSDASRRLAIMQAAHDGLVPDGREGALVPFSSKNGKVAQWLPMVQGIRKKARNSGMVKNLYCHVVHQRDVFAIELGTEPKVIHQPYLGTGDRGPMTHVYSVAVLEDDEISVDWMTKAEVDEARKISRAQSGPWFSWYNEMARKTVTKRHCKQLPMSSDLADMLQRDDELERESEPRDITPPKVAPKAISGDAFDAFAGNGSGEAQEPAQEAPGEPPEPEKPTRRPTKRQQAEKAQAASQGPTTTVPVEELEPIGEAPPAPERDSPTHLESHLLEKARGFTDFAEAMDWWSSNKASIRQVSEETRKAIHAHLQSLG